ncbi:MAG: O-antigen ligase family protein [Planctomycetales bacterium]|nr:O-antigen ligase family protein [Planctomycetales bacterium]
MPTDRHQLAETLDAASRLAVVLLGFSIAVSTSLSSVLVIVIACLWLATGDLSGKLRRIAANPLAWLPLVLFAWFLVGVAYTSVSPGECLRGATKYRELLYIPILLTLLPASNAKLGGLADVVEAIRQRRLFSVDWRTWSVAGFIFGNLCELAASYGEWLFDVDWGFPTETDHVVFKDRIIHNFLLAYMLFVLAHDSLPTLRWRWAAITIGGITLVNMVAMVQGRTGYLALGVLTVVFMVQKFGGRGIAYAAACLAVLAGTAFAGSATFRFRVQESLLQVQTSLGQQVAPADARMTAEEPRLKFYQRAIEIISRQPFLGFGTGSFEKEYAAVTSDSNAPPTVDPHNEYLAITSQSGLIGLGFWFAILIGQWKTTWRLPAEERQLSQGMLALMAAGCLVNSLLLGFTGGLFWAYFAAVFFTSAEQSAAHTALSSDQTSAEMPLTLRSAA